MRKGGSTLPGAPIESEWINTLIYSTNIDWTPAAPIRDVWFPSKILEQPNTVNKEFLSIRIKLSWFLKRQPFLLLAISDTDTHRTLCTESHLVVCPGCFQDQPVGLSVGAVLIGCEPPGMMAQGEPSAAQCQHGPWSGWATQATLSLSWPQIWAPVFDKDFMVVVKIKCHTRNIVLSTS